MNQILQVKEADKKKKTSKLKDLIIFLIIFMIIFGAIIGLYAIYQYIANGIFTKGNSQNIPVITLNQTEDNKLEVKVESEIGLATFTYKLNDEPEETIKTDAIKNMEKIIDLPIGENNIYICVTDTNGEKVEKQEKYIVEATKPIIELSVVGNEMKISVTSEVELKEVTYAWNSETEKRENILTYENRNKFEKKIKIPIGKNTLKIVAIDANGEKTEKIQEIKGVTKAKTTVKVEGDYWIFNVVGQENIKTVEFEFNGKKYIMTTNTFGTTKKVKYRVKLQEGKNYLEITSTTESDGVDVTSWEQEYTKR